MKHYIIAFIFAFLTSCIPLAPDAMSFKLDFYNNSNLEIMVVKDFDTQDERVSPGSDFETMRPKQHGITASHAWQTIISDSLHLYVINPKDLKEDFGSRGVLNESQAMTIKDDIILQVFTIHHGDVVPGTEVSFVFTYP